MWALRRASHPLKNHRFSISILRVHSPKPDWSCFGDNAGIVESCQATSGRYPSLERSYCSTSLTHRLSMGSRLLSSQPGAESSGEEEEDAFSELEEPVSTKAVQKVDSADESEDELVSEPELSADEDAEKASQNEFDLPENEMESTKKKSRKRATSKLFEAINSASGLSVHQILDKWVEDGKEINREEISLAMFNFRKRRIYGKALLLSEWLDSSKRLDPTEGDYASRLDLIAKVRGLPKAESFFNKIPESFRGELVHRSLLANYVTASNVTKAEETFNKMRDRGFSPQSFSFNQLLLLYKRLDKKKIADVLLLMEKENVKPTMLTYRLLIDTKGQSNDITGMEKIVDAMKAEGIKPDIGTQALLAKHYASSGLIEKAKAVLKEMEGGDLKKHWWACQSLLPLYADIGEADEVERVWKVCEPNPRLEECIAAIEAWGKLKKIPEAEAIFERMSKTWKVSSKHYTVLLKVYASNKMLAKGKDLVKRMADSGCRIGPFTWDSIVKLYVEAGEVEKADSVLTKASQQNQMKPMFSSYMSLLDHYAKRGDVHNTEKILYRMRQSGYTSRIRQYQCLLNAYAKGKVPAYGIRERLKVEGITPTRSMESQLAQIDPFRKTLVSDLLD
ncbi:pentatricopeptide repeat-containing protein At1g80270, mitochondrial-like [Syzygium oleosum]|uniref:pentatricopeptide repeat-containing protein At1g80270, mitochondrial-like n=1 Tax=Syzygium oleosum TaxID=219896 RepID=UPI0024BBA388|nr:pentatricopeptide repeat-containing protein At1g80270, mitochondrial-like [Syzygium oleosum]XP_056171072.1 pentatricopeptide repeat-containing protein At1g80270, mitochondrial-like [Syzygium oleosum]XP_056171073.1 pentatricopeptide repeat-containing protein At1g80270, mitochondrial-like [Syzygium oleosum]